MNYILRKKKHLIIKLMLVPFISFYFATCFAMEVPIYDFPIDAYSQNADDYFSSKEENGNKALLSPEYQRKQLQQFYTHYYASDMQGLSPWSEQLVQSLLPLIKENVPQVLEKFSNQNKAREKKHYAENFKEHDQNWWNKIRDNMKLDALISSEFKAEHRAISITNTLARALPDRAPDFFHTSLAGEGFPFDNLQESAIWAGTPLYVVSISKDRAWSLVLTPDGYWAWVSSQDIAYTSTEFIQRWQQAVKHGLLAVTQTEASIFNEAQHFQFTGYIGAVFPLIATNAPYNSILIPSKNTQNQAIITTGTIHQNASSIMPLAATQNNFVTLLNQLKNRPYGWGGSFFFNDCSQEMKSIFTPFALWLPRNSRSQAQLGSNMDLSKYTTKERIALLKEKGHPLMTLIYIGGHIMLYVGQKEHAAITYQNLWGLSPATRDKRYIIGQSLFFPLLTSYPENLDLSSLASGSTFKLIYLDTLDTNTDSPHDFVNRFFMKKNT